jgi:hypothetical protein
MQRYVDFLNLNSPKLGPLTNYFTNEYIDYANDFDVAKVQDQAKNYKP